MAIYLAYSSVITDCVMSGITRWPGEVAENTVRTAPGMPLEFSHRGKDWTALHKAQRSSECPLNTDSTSCPFPPDCAKGSKLGS